jgi:flagellar biosynthesis activator protein FlaF
MAVPVSAGRQISLFRRTDHASASYYDRYNRPRAQSGAFAQEANLGVSAYRRTIVSTESPRAVEHRLLGQVTGALITAMHTGQSGSALVDTLHWNREMWSTFSATCAGSDNRLPPALRASIISLALWVDRHTSEVIAGKASVEDLIEVNRMIMDGLSAPP